MSQSMWKSFGGTLWGSKGPPGQGGQNENGAKFAEMAIIKVQDKVGFVGSRALYALVDGGREN